MSELFPLDVDEVKGYLRCTLEEELLDGFKKENVSKGYLLQIISQLICYKFGHSPLPSVESIEWLPNDRDLLIHEIEKYREEILRLGGSLKKSEFGKIQPSLPSVELIEKAIAKFADNIWEREHKNIHEIHHQDLAKSIHQLMTNGNPRQETDNKESAREIIGIAIGEASMCWSETPKGVFQSERALKIIDRVMKQLMTNGNGRE